MTPTPAVSKTTSSKSEPDSDGIWTSDYKRLSQFSLSQEGENTSSDDFGASTWIDAKRGIQVRKPQVKKEEVTHYTRVNRPVKLFIKEKMGTQNTFAKAFRFSDQNTKCDNRIIIVRYGIPGALITRAKSEYNKGKKITLDFKGVLGTKFHWTYDPSTNAYGHMIGTSIFEEWFHVDGAKWDFISGDISPEDLKSFIQSLKNCGAVSIGIALNFNPKYGDTSSYMGSTTTHPFAIPCKEGCVWLSARKDDQSESSKWPYLVQTVYRHLYRGEKVLLNVSLNHRSNNIGGYLYNSMVYNHGGTGVEHSLGCSIATANGSSNVTTVNSSSAATDLIGTLFSLDCPIYEVGSKTSYNQKDFFTSTFNVWLSDSTLAALDGFQRAPESVDSKTLAMKGGPRPDLDLYLRERGQRAPVKVAVDSHLTTKEIAMLCGSAIIGLVTGWFANLGFKKYLFSQSQAETPTKKIKQQRAALSFKGLDGIVICAAHATRSVVDQKTKIEAANNSLHSSLLVLKQNFPRVGFYLTDFRSTCSNHAGKFMCQEEWEEQPLNEVEVMGALASVFRPVQQNINTLLSLTDPSSQLVFNIVVEEEAIEEHNSLTPKDKSEITQAITNLQNKP